MNHASKLPMSAVSSCVIENVTLAVAITFGRASGLGNFTAIFSPKVGRSIITTVMPRKIDFAMEPSTSPVSK